MKSPVCSIGNSDFLSYEHYRTFGETSESVMSLQSTSFNQAIKLILNVLVTLYLAKHAT